MRELFDNTVTQLASVGTPEQLNALFLRVCVEFFGIVSPIEFVKYDDYRTLLIGDLIDLGRGNIEVTRLVEVKLNGVPTLAVVTVPIDFQHYTLKQSYVGDFLMTCEVFLNRMDITNMGILKGSGLDEFNIEPPMTIDELRIRLEQKHSVESVCLVS